MQGGWNKGLTYKAPWTSHVAWNKGLTKKDNPSLSRTKTAKLKFKLIREQKEKEKIDKWNDYKKLTGYEKTKRWVSKHREKARFYCKQRKLRRKQIIGSHTFEEWLDVKLFYQNMCACCKKSEPIIKLTEDHIIPITKGGTDFIDNIQPLCLSCNSKKSDNTIFYMPINNQIFSRREEVSKSN